MNEPPTNPWMERLFRPLLISLLVCLVAWSLVDVLALLLPLLDRAFLSAACVLGAVQANYTHLLLLKRRELRAASFRFRLVELTTLLIVLRIGSLIGDDWSSITADIASWSRDGFAVLDDETVFAFIMAFACWYAGTQTLDDLENLNELARPHFSYVPRLERLTTRFFGGGAALLLAIALTHVRLPGSRIFAVDRPVGFDWVLGALLYFVLGLVMLGQTQLSKLRHEWQAQDAEISARLPERWLRHSLTFVGLSVLLAWLLPTSYSLGLLDAARFVFFVFFQFAGSLALLFVTLVTLPLQILLWLLALLLGSSAPPPNVSAPEFTVIPAAETTSGADWLALVKSLLFWGLLLAALFYVLRSYWRDHPELAQAVRSRGLLPLLRRCWAALKRWLRRWRRAFQARLPARLMRAVAARRLTAAQPWHFFRLRALSPRERVFYYYLSLLRRAGRLGYPRRRDQTPYEYQADWPALPQAQDEAKRLTEAFVEARYSQHGVDAGQERRARAAWQRVRADLRTLIHKKRTN